MKSIPSNLHRIVTAVQARISEAHGQGAMRSFLAIAGSLKDKGPSLADALDVNDQHGLMNLISAFEDLSDRWRQSQAVVDAVCSLILVKCAVYSVPLPDFVMNSSAEALARQRMLQLVDGADDEDSGAYTDAEAALIVHNEKIARGDLPEGSDPPEVDDSDDVADDVSDGDDEDEPVDG